MEKLRNDKELNKYIHGLKLDDKMSKQFEEMNRLIKYVDCLPKDSHKFIVANTIICGSISMLIYGVYINFRVCINIRKWCNSLQKRFEFDEHCDLS